MYQALYRKWRSMTFDEVVGQQHVVSLIKNSIAAGRISHAYLLCGIRGTGKTTIAKLLAKAVNCERPEDGNPCNKCASCVSINSGSNIDVSEIDAASNNGVDNIRDIRDEVQYTPAMSKYKVFIIDEVHMLSTGAFNALLKTLEEPPSHVVFILATTELAKVPATIVSRCQHFDFRRIAPADIAGRLCEVCARESVEIEAKAAELIARLADGALRDALSILDQCISSGEAVTYSLVAQMTGLGGRDYLQKMIDATANKDCTAALSIEAELFDGGKEPSAIFDELSTSFRDLLIIKSVRDYSGLLLSPPDEAERLVEQAERFTLEDVLLLLSTLQAAVDNSKFSQNKRLELEITLIKLCSPKALSGIDALTARIAQLEAQILTGTIVQQTPSSVKPQPEHNEKKAAPSPKTAETPVIASQPISAPVQSDFNFSKIGAELNAAYDKSIANVMKGVTYKSSGDKVVIEFESDFQAAFAANDSVKKQITAAIASVTGRTFEVIISKRKAGDKPSEPADNLFQTLVDRAKSIPDAEIK